jgi:hypothetical protein
MKNQNRQKGQAAIEFVFALLFIIIITAALFQALSFELDVFNQSMVARFELFREAHQSQDTTPCRSINKQFQGRKVSEFAPWRVPYQDSSIRNLKYGPKRYYGERGTKYIDRTVYGGVGLHAWYSWFLLFAIPDHYEDSADKISGPLGGAITALAAEFWIRGC